jgi:hypothetical protein
MRMPPTDPLPPREPDTKALSRDLKDTVRDATKRAGATSAIDAKEAATIIRTVRQPSGNRRSGSGASGD